MASARIVFECFTLLLVSTIFVVPAAGINCYQCVSTNNIHPFQCNEYLSSDIDMEPESCDDVYDAKFCVKHVGRFEDGVGTKRFCSSADLGNYCQEVQQTGDMLEYRTCVYTCNTDGCNPGSTSKPNFITTAISLISLFFMLVWRR